MTHFWKRRRGRGEEREKGTGEEADHMHIMACSSRPPFFFFFLKNGGGESPISVGLPIPPVPNPNFQEEEAPEIER